MVQANSISLVLSVVCLVSCHKQTLKTDGNQSAVKVTNSMALGDTDYMSVVRLGTECTATLIRPNLLITTAVCAQKNNNFIVLQEYREKLFVEDRAILDKVIHPEFDVTKPLNGYNLALLKIQPYLIKDKIKPGAIAIDSTTLDKENINFEMVGFGCMDQAEPYMRGLKRKGKNVFKKPIAGGVGILAAQGTGMTTMNYDAPHANSMGCLGDEGAPALVDNKIVGVYLGQKQINGKKNKEAIFADLALPANKVFIKKYADPSPCLTIRTK